MRLHTASITADVYARAATGSAGSTLRGLLGATSSIIPADMLRRYTRAADLPTLPLLAWRGGVTSTNAGGITRLFFNWYAYDNSEKQYIRINPIIDELTALYPLYPYGIFPGYDVTGYNETQERPDSAVFNLPVRALTIQLTTRI